MCVYCMIGDDAFKYDPPWKIMPYEHPSIPQPANPHKPVTDWDIQRVKDYLEILKQVKAMEDQLGCPCEPNKADYIKLFSERVAELTKELKDTKKAGVCKCKTCKCGETPLKRAKLRKKK